ncbi:hypothetical protein DLAC_10591 [Tieghemostelium lacteum]|uniref:Uncharacterized protein n=1 Tax=Tieghemostelium lacteum TaxID=361077 RepID=A0A151Z4R7_TIELA|nr:hypothetical protein DLAC_10591 [Tieghemostelium lacteum]|eukprot:KYQ88794.1 hypothetical protein DLAC_10591 [Tieghemostelium lacteum]
MTTISIIGTAGRNKRNPLLISHFEYMCNKVKSFISQHELLSKSKEITLVSGGAAWADQIAVELYLEDPIKYNLILYLPCPIVEKENKYVYYDSNSSDWRLNPGRSSNNYHISFTKQIGKDSIGDIMKAKELGAVIDTSSNGFHSRNTKVAKSDYILAFTFGKGEIPEKSGTLDTWNKSKSTNKYHFTLPATFLTKPIASSETITTTATLPSVEKILSKRSFDSFLLSSPTTEHNNNECDLTKKKLKSDTLITDFFQKIK